MLTEQSPVVSVSYLFTYLLTYLLTVCPASCKLTFDFLTLKVVSESRVTWATSVPILVFLGLSVLDCTRQTDVRRASSFNTSALWGRGHNNAYFKKHLTCGVRSASGLHRHGRCGSICLMHNQKYLNNRIFQGPVTIAFHFLSILQI